MRARNIKPGFFKNELLGQADPLLSILFAGLWCLADKGGRLEDRPLRIKAETFPYREGLDINRYLTDLERLGFIQRYVVDGVAIIQVLKFGDHQHPHTTEKESELPENTNSCPITVVAPLSNGCNPSDSLIPDSLIPDSNKTEQPPLKKRKTKSSMDSSFKPKGLGAIFDHMGPVAAKACNTIFYAFSSGFPEGVTHLHGMKPLAVQMLKCIEEYGADPEIIASKALQYREFIRLIPATEQTFQIRILKWMDEETYLSELQSTHPISQFERVSE